ncbi:MAG: hypothetical protein PHS80_04120 [Methanothrix sp.]|nr:hypothetical protein [Methanothrix sp.]MDD4446361.1 hypothetical protein [Methanothrix sp.]
MVVAIRITKRVVYIWQDRWNKWSYEGLIPQYAGGRSSKLTDAKKGQLVQLPKQDDTWTAEEVRVLIFKEFRIILKNIGIKCANHFLATIEDPQMQKEF